MQKKRILILILIIVLVPALLTSTYAFMVRQSQTAGNNFLPATVSCRVNEETDGDYKTEITVENTGNAEAYIRIRLVFYWVDSKGVPVSKTITQPTFKYDDNNWIKDTSDGFTYYCKSPITPGNSTPDFLLGDSTITMDPYTEDFNNGSQVIKYEYYPVLEIIAEAIQSQPADAVEEAWPYVVVQSDRTLKH